MLAATAAMLLTELIQLKPDLAAPERLLVATAELKVLGDTAAAVVVSQLRLTQLKNIAAAIVTTRLTRLPAMPAAAAGPAMALAAPVAPIVQPAVLPEQTAAVAAARGCRLTILPVLAAMEK